MKRLLKSTTPPNTVTVASEADKKRKPNKYDFTSADLVDILQQIEELDCNVAARYNEGILQIAVGDSIYEVSEVQSQRYPRRRLRKLET